MQHRLRIVLLTLSLCLHFTQTVQARDDQNWQSFAEAFVAHKGGQIELARALKQLGQSNRTEAENAKIQALLETAREKGHPCAYFSISIQTSDLNERIKLLRYAVDKGLRPAASRLGQSLYRHGRGDTDDYPEAFELFQIASQSKDQDAQFYLARMHHFGHGTHIDLKSARNWYAQAVENNSIRAANNLGNLWINGEGGATNLKKGMYYQQLASDGGMAMASYNLGQHYRTKVPDAPDWEQAIHYYQLALEQSDNNYPDAAYRLGLVYRDGLGVTYDIDKAKDYLELATESQNPKALFSLGWFYESGKHGVPDTKRASEYYKQAADLGHAQAMCNYAWYLWETAPDESLDEIERLNINAISKGNTNAMSNWGYLHLYQKWPNFDTEKGLHLVQQAANKGYTQAIKNLIYYYEGNQDLIAPQPDTAQHWRQRLK